MLRTTFVQSSFLLLLLAAAVGGSPARGESGEPATSVGHTESPYYGYRTHPGAFDAVERTADGGDLNFVAPQIVETEASTGPVTPPGAFEGLPPTVPPTFAAPSYGRGEPLHEWHAVPGDVLFRSFIAGVHSPRMGGEIVTDDEQGTLLDVTIGSTISVVRHGTLGPDAEGWELQVYGAALARLGMDRQSDLEATDYKFGVPVVFRRGPTAVRIGYDHLSSHVGDEFLIRNPGFERRNYVRDAIALAAIQDLTDSVAVYGEVNNAFHTSGGAERWHFQFGAEYQPPVPAGFHGAPVAAVNTLLREEFGYEGSLGIVAGWQWRGVSTDDLLRLGLSFYTGKSRQFSFYDRNEKLVGVGLWYDF